MSQYGSGNVPQGALNHAPMYDQQSLGAAMLNAASSKPKSEPLHTTTIQGLTNSIVQLKEANALLTKLCIEYFGDAPGVNAINTPPTSEKGKMVIADQITTLLVALELECRQYKFVLSVLSARI